jgi:hypothetical protein
MAACRLVAQYQLFHLIHNLSNLVFFFDGEGIVNNRIMFQQDDAHIRIHCKRGRNSSDIAGSS